MKLNIPKSRFGALLVGIYLLFLLLVIGEFLSGPMKDMAGMGMAIFTFPSSLLVFGITAAIAKPVSNDWLFFALFLTSWLINACLLYLVGAGIGFLADRLASAQEGAIKQDAESRGGRE